jgi:Tol biopolymer transport system component
MTWHRLGIALAVALPLALASGLSAQNLEVELQRAIQRHSVTREHGAAIEAYRRIADQADASGLVAVAVEARLRLAETYRDAGNAKAREVYEEIIARYPAHAKTATAMRTGHSRRLLDKQIWDNNFPEWPMASPDGTQVLYTWWNGQDPGPGFQLRVMPIRVGSTSRQLLSGTEFTYLSPIGWSPDGRRALAFGATADDAQLLWVDTVDGTWRLLKSLGQSDGTGRYSLSPDGRYVAYSRLVKPKERNAQGRWVVTAPDQHIYVLPTDGPGEEVALVTGNNINEAPVWTPDGKRILFVSNRGTDTRFGLWSVAVEDGRRAGGEMYVGHGPTGRVSPIGVTDAGALYYVPERVAPGIGFDIFVADLETPGGRVTGTPVRLLDTNLDSNISPAWSPDGQRIAFVRARPGARDPNERYEIVVYSLSTRNERTLFSTYLGNTAPMWLRDGSALLVRRNYNNGLLGRWNPEADEEPRSVEAMAHAGLPVGWLRAAVSPDDRTLYFLVQDHAPEVRQRLVAFDLTSGEDRTVWTLTGRAVATGSLAMRPDGRSVSW